jgi:hypothetical protein
MSAMAKRKKVNCKGEANSNPIFVKENVAPQMKVTTTNINSAFQAFIFEF